MMEFHRGSPPGPPPLTSFSSPRASSVRDSPPRHPLSPGRSWLPQRTPSPPSLPASTIRDPFDLHNKRLQLRNAGFRGACLPSESIANQLPAWRSPSSSSSEEGEDKENQSTLSPARHRHSRRSLSGGRRLHVLGGIQSSPQRCRVLSQSSITTALHDSPTFGTAATFISSPTSTRRSSRADPLEDSDTDSITGRGRRPFPSTPILSSPLEMAERTTHIKGNMSSHETIKYIEHLEAQLSACQTELNSVKSPSMKPQRSQARALNTEINVLRQEIAEWEARFESRVHEELAVRTTTESKLRAKMHALESRAEADSVRIKELECERDLQLQKGRNAEALKATNRSLERRVDVLTELLAQSPTRSEFCRSPIRGAMSPTRSPGPRLSRPQSMLPTFPVSRRGSFDKSPGSISQSVVNESKQSPGLSTEEGASQSIADQNEPVETGRHDSSPLSTATESVRSDSSPSSASHSKSQRSSTISQLSSISSQWSLPFPFSPDLQSKTHNRQKSMRRFPSGTCTLKPLILPSTSLSNDTHMDEMLSPDNAEPSNPPFDPRIPFPEMPDEDLDDYHASVAQQSTLNALEGHSNFYRTFDEVLLEAKTQIPLSSDPLMTLRGGSSRSPKARTTNLAAELSAFGSQDGLDKNSDLGTNTSGVSDSQRACSDAENSIDHIINRLAGAKSFSESQTEVSDDSDAYASHTGGILGVALSLVSNYRRRLLEFNRLLSVLAHRIFSNVTTSTRFGNIIWWMVGLLVGRHDRDLFLRPTASFTVRNGNSSQKHSAVNKAGCPPVSHRSRRPNKHRKLRRLSQSSVLSSLSRPGQPSSLACCTTLEQPAASADYCLRHSIFLWAKFSIAIVVAIGMAFKHGPQSLMADPLKAISEKDSTHDIADHQSANDDLTTDTETLIDEEQGINPTGGDYPDPHDFVANPDSPESGTLTWTPNLTIEDFLTG